jgi:hypothetical protein
VNLVLSINNITLEVDVDNKNYEGPTHETLSTSNLLSFPHLPTKHMHNRKPLIDYSQSHKVDARLNVSLLPSFVLHKSPKTTLP